MSRFDLATQFSPRSPPERARFPWFAKLLRVACFLGEKDNQHVRRNKVQAFLDHREKVQPRCARFKRRAGLEQASMSSARRGMTPSVHRYLPIQQRCRKYFSSENDRSGHHVLNGNSAKNRGDPSKGTGGCRKLSTCSCCFRLFERRDNLAQISDGAAVESFESMDKIVTGNRFS